MHFFFFFYYFRRLKVAEFSYSDACSKVAEMAEGMSGREITNLALDWQMTTYASRDGVFTEDIMLKRTAAAVEHRKHKVCIRCFVMRTDLFVNIAMNSQEELVQTTVKLGEL